MPSLRSLTKSVFYGALDVSTGGRGVRRVINGEPIRFPARWYRYFPADYEAGNFAFVRAHCRAGHTALDIGAHIGLYSVLMAHLVGPDGRVFAFEPTPGTLDVLRETVRLNGCADRVEVRGEAVARQTGTATFYDTGHDVSNANSLVRSEGSQRGLTVPTVSLDDFAARHDLSVNCLKIDVEGAELDVLVGGEQTFMRCRPAVALNLHPPFVRAAGQSMDDIWRVLRQYDMRVLYEGREVEEAWFCAQPNLFDVHLLPR